MVGVATGMIDVTIDGAPIPDGPLIALTRKVYELPAVRPLTIALRAPPLFAVIVV